MAYFSASTFRILGSAATTQNLLTIENGTGTGKSVAVRGLDVYMDTNTAILTAATVQFKANLATSISGGTALTKAAWHTANTASQANVVIRSATASDGGAATAITATLGSSLFQGMGIRYQTLAGPVWSHIPCELLPQKALATSGIVLASGEGLCVNIATNATTQNPATNMYIVNVVWEEI